MVLGGRFRPEPQKFVTFGHFPHFSSHFMKKRGKAEKTRKCTFPTFWAESDPRGGGWKPLPAAMFFMFSWLWRHFPPKISFLVEMCTISSFSWKWPEIRTFRWTGGPCRSTPQKTICFVSEFQCFARPEKVWKTQNFCFFMIFLDLRENRKF